MKNIIVLGDSFTFGQGCSDRNWYYDNKKKVFVGDHTLITSGPSKECWASLLQNDYPNYEVKNFAIPGENNIGQSIKGQNIIDQDTVMVFFSLAPINRIQVKHHSLETLESWVLSQDEILEDIPKEYINAKEYFLKYLYHEQALINSSINAFLSIYAAANTVNAKCFISAFPLDIPKLIGSSKTFTNLYFKSNIMHLYDLVIQRHRTYFSLSMKGIKPFNDDMNPNNSLRADDYHASSRGHRVYYDTIIKPLVTDYL